MEKKESMKSSGARIQITGSGNKCRLNNRWPVNSLAAPGFWPREGKIVKQVNNLTQKLMHMS